MLDILCQNINILKHLISRISLNFELEQIIMVHETLHSSCNHCIYLMFQLWVYYSTTFPHTNILDHLYTLRKLSLVTYIHIKS